MLRWTFRRTAWQSYEFVLMDEFKLKQFPISEVSLPMMPYLVEILTDVLFARKINSDKTFNLDKLSDEDQMDLLMVSIWKLEDDSEG